MSLAKYVLNLFSLFHLQSPLSRPRHDCFSPGSSRAPSSTFAVSNLVSTLLSPTSPYFFFFLFFFFKTIPCCSLGKTKIHDVSSMSCWSSPCLPLQSPEGMSLPFAAGAPASFDFWEEVSFILPQNRCHAAPCMRDALPSPSSLLPSFLPPSLPPSFPSFLSLLLANSCSFFTS